jgi:hypothetical protein
MKSFEEVLSMAKLQDMINTKKEDGEGKKVLWVLAIIGAVALVIVIAVAVYKYLTPDNVDEFDDEFDDDFDDDFFDDDDDEFVEEILVEDTEE